jgi:glycosyltransferase involved in cell wall biosynthesis
MTILRVIVDDMVNPSSRGVGVYTEELSRELIAVAPPGCFVEAMVSASSEADYEYIEQRLPGLSVLHKSALARRELTAAWQHGFTKLPGTGMVHAPSLLAPLSRHDRLNNPGEQIAVTVHDVAAWTYPESLSSRAVSWQKAMVKRAHKYADAVVVPTHAVAVQLNEILDFGDRVRVIGGAASSKLVRPVDADTRAARLGLPERYVLSVGRLDPRRGTDQLLAAMARPDAPDLPVVVVGSDDAAEVAAAAVDAGLPEHRIHSLGFVSDADYAVVLERATVFVFPGLEEGLGLPLIEAFKFGTPVVHSDVPALIEVGADAGIVVPREDRDGYPERLALAISAVVNDYSLAERLRFQGIDRSKAFSWRGSAEKVWQLHADL